RLGVAAIAQRRRYGAVVADEDVAELVELARGDSRLHMRRDEVERLGGQPAGPSHALEAFRSVQLDRAFVAPPVVGPVVDEIAGAAHDVYLACEMVANKGRGPAWPSWVPSLMS